MKNHIKRSLRTLTWVKVGKIDGCESLNREVQDNLGINKRDLRADVLSLLSSALRPRLLGVQESEECDEIGLNRGGFRLNVVKIVVMTTILGGFGLFSMNVATPVSAASLTLSVPTDALKLDLQPNNTFSKSSASSVSVKTDAFAGYTLSIKAKSSNDLVNGGNKISSITGNLTEDQYKASGNTNTWGYQPSKINGSANTAFLPGPTTSPSTIEKTSAKNDTANNYNIILGAKIDSTLPNGTYANTFVFTATANAVSYNITYNLNQGSWTGTSPQTGNTVENTVKINDATPTRNGFTFEGWCTSSTSNENCPGSVIKPGSDYILSNSANNVTLYAIWKIAPMQTWTGCNDLAQDSSVNLVDSRDNVTYRVTRLKDGQCWMTSNLRIIDKTVSQNDSDTSGTFIIPASSKWTDGSVTGKHAHYAGDTTNGAYYTWSVATAGSGDNLPATGTAQYSICPKGWKLPTYNDYSNMMTLYGVTKDAAGATAVKASPLYFVANGVFYYEQNMLENFDQGYYWTASKQDNPFMLYFSSSTALLGRDSNDLNQASGQGLRCIKR